MSKILLIAEKHAHVCAILRAMPDLEKYNHIDIVDFRGLGCFRFDYPRNLPISKVPFIEPVKWRIQSRSEIKWLTKNPMTPLYCFYTHPRTETTAHTGFIDIDEQLELAKHQIDSYNEIVLCPDPDHRGVFCGTQVLEYLIQDSYGLTSKITHLRFTGMDSKSIQGDWANRANYKAYKHPAAQYGEVKYYFDWLWSINSAPVFGKALRIAGADSGRILSKYELLLFLSLANGKLLGRKKTTEANICIAMGHRYTGTGKYEKKKYNWCGIGSPTSYGQIIENLIERKLIDRQFQLTPEGERFYGLVHRRSFDPDLPFRLADWCESCDKEGVEKYIRGFFKRQKNFNSIHTL